MRSGAARGASARAAAPGRSARASIAAALAWLLAAAIQPRGAAAQDRPAAAQALGGPAPALRLGAECAADPRGAALLLEPELVAGLEWGGLSAELRAPALARLGSRGSCFALGDVEAGLSARLRTGEALLRAGARLAAPTGPPGRPAQAGSARHFLPSGWKAALSLERAAVLDPAAMAARLDLGIFLPRRGEAAAPRLMLGTGLSLAEALNARISLGVSAWVSAWLALGREPAPRAPGGPSQAAGALFGGGASVRALWRGERIELSAGLGAGFGIEAEGPALEFGLVREIELSRRKPLFAEAAKSR